MVRVGRGSVWLFALQACGQSDSPQGQVLEGTGVCFCVGDRTGRRGAWGEHVKGLDAGVFDCMCKEQGTGSKASRDYQCTAQDSWNQGPEGQAFQETGSQPAVPVSLCLSLSETVPSLVSRFFQCIWPLASVL